MSLLDSSPLPHHFSADHEQFRAAMRAFVAKQITPFVHEWDEAGTFPRSLYRAVAELGVTGVGFPEPKSERIDREVKVMMIGGGSEEILEHLAARQLGF